MVSFTSSIPPTSSQLLHLIFKPSIPCCHWSNLCSCITPKQIKPKKRRISSELPSSRHIQNITLTCAIILKQKLKGHQTASWHFSKKTLTSLLPKSVLNQNPTIHTSQTIRNPRMLGWGEWPTLHHYCLQISKLVVALRRQYVCSEDIFLCFM